MGNNDAKNDIGLRIENAILKSQKEITKHMSKEIKELRTETQNCFDKLPCKQNTDDIKKNATNFRILVIVLVSIGVFGGGGSWALRLFGVI